MKKTSRIPFHFPDKLAPFSFTFIFGQREEKKMKIQSHKKNQRNMNLISIISPWKYENIVAIKMLNE